MHCRRIVFHGKNTKESSKKKNLKLLANKNSVFQIVTVYAHKLQLVVIESQKDVYCNYCIVKVQYSSLFLRLYYILLRQIR